MHDFYNRLSDVETASAALNTRPGFAAYLKDFSQLVTSLGVADVFGTRLLHKHYDVDSATAVIERCREPDGERVLRSSVEPIPAVPVPPSAWAWTADGLTALEFSEDDSVERAQARLQPGFVEDWSVLIKRTDLVDLLGLTVVQRHYLQPRAHHVFVETSDAVASTVSLRPSTDTRDSDIVTVWVAEPAAACRPGNYCRKWSTCRRSGSPPDDRHSVSYGHDAMQGPHGRG